MTYEEALNRPLIGFNKDGKDYYELSDDWIETIDEALEKQIPKKPIIIKEGKVLVKIDCPNCNAGLRPFQAFCDCCGQCIDWSEVEE